MLDPDAARSSPSSTDRGGSLEELASEQAVVDEIAAAVERANAKLARVEQIKRFKLLPAEWLPGERPELKLETQPIARKSTGRPSRVDTARSRLSTRESRQRG